MKINKNVIAKLNPCADRFNNFKKQYPDFDNSLQEFIILENITYSDKVWVVTNLFTKEQNIKWSILCASKVLSIFEKQHPKDKRPRLALEAAEAYLKNPCEETKKAAYAAAYAANAAANAASAAYTATYAAASAAYAASAASATSYAAASAAYAASAANAATNEKEQEEVNLLLMLECL